MQRRLEASSAIAPGGGSFGQLDPIPIRNVLQLRNRDIRHGKRSDVVLNTIQNYMHFASYYQKKGGALFKEKAVYYAKLAVETADRMVEGDEFAEGPPDELPDSDLRPLDSSVSLIRSATIPEQQEKEYPDFFTAVCGVEDSFALRSDGMGAGLTFLGASWEARKVQTEKDRLLREEAGLLPPIAENAGAVQGNDHAADYLSVIIKCGRLSKQATTLSKQATTY